VRRYFHSHRRYNQPLYADEGRKRPASGYAGAAIASAYRLRSLPFAGKWPYVMCTGEKAATFTLSNVGCQLWPGDAPLPLRDRRAIRRSWGRSAEAKGGGLEGSALRVGRSGRVVSERPSGPVHITSTCTPTKRFSRFAFRAAGVFCRELRRSIAFGG
jgi:hypothetical protein